MSGAGRMAGYACAHGRPSAEPKASEGRERSMNVATSFALWAAAPAPGGGSGFCMLLPILLLIPLMYLLMIRPQQKRQKQWQQMLSSIKSGDRVTTAGGIRGTIISIKDDSISFACARQPEARNRQERDRFGHHAGELSGLLRLRLVGLWTERIGTMKKNLKNKIALIIAVLLLCLYGIFGIPSGISGKALLDACPTGFTWAWIFRAART